MTKCMRDLSCHYFDDSAVIVVEGVEFPGVQRDDSDQAVLRYEWCADTATESQGVRARCIAKIQDWIRIRNSLTISGDPATQPLSELNPRATDDRRPVAHRMRGDELIRGVLIEIENS